MKIINKVTLRHLQLNKKRTLVTMLGIIVSVAMIMAVSTTAYSFLDVMVRNEMKSKGEWHLQYREVLLENTDQIITDNNTKSAMLSRQIGYARLEGSQNKQKPYVFIEAYDASALNGMPIDLIEGKLPTKDDELLIASHIEENANVIFEIGDTVTYNVGNRYKQVEQERTELDQRDSLQGDVSGQLTEAFEETGEVKTYTVVGIMQRPETEPYSAPGYTVITYLDKNTLAKTDTVNVSVLLNHVSSDLYDNLQSMAKEVGITSENMITNDNVLALMGASYDSSINRTLYVLEFILIVIIMTGSISLIYNAFSISISERSKHLGMLASVGATKKQKRSSVFFESFLVGIISIPLGVLAGIGGMAVTFLCINPIFKSVLGYDVGLQVKVSPETVVVAVLFSVVTILISAYIPARRASKITPIDAIRQTQDIKLKSTTVKTSKLTRKLFGFEGELALKNLKRYKRRYRATVFSLIISIILFLTASAYGYYLKNAFALTQPETNYDAAVAGIAIDDKTLIPKVQAIASITDSTVIHFLANRFSLDQEMSHKYMSAESKQYITKHTNEDVTKYETQIEIYVLDETSLATYAAHIGVKMESLQDTSQLNCILINQILIRDEYSVAKIKPFQGNVNDVLPLRFIGETADTVDTVNVPLADVRIAGITKELPMGLSNTRYSSTPLILIISEVAYNQVNENLNQIMKETNASVNHDHIAIFLETKTPSHFQQELVTALGKDTVDRLSIENAYQVQKEVNQTLTLISVFAYGFIALITIICVANIFNTISTSIALRRREFAMLKSVGMTPKSFNKMIAFESIFYGVKALVYGLPISIVVIYLVYTTVRESAQSSFTLPWRSILVAIVSVFIVVGSSMIYAGGKIKKENVIDALKSENM